MFLSMLMNEPRLTSGAFSCPDVYWLAGSQYVTRGFRSLMPSKPLILSIVLLVLCVGMASAQAPFPVSSVVDDPTIAGRAVALDAEGKLLPWPIPEDTGYSYSNYFLSQWTIVWDQYNRQRLPYYFCCFDFDRIRFELVKASRGMRTRTFSGCVTPRPKMSISKGKADTLGPH